MGASRQAGLARASDAKANVREYPLLPSITEPLHWEARGDERHARGDYATAADFFARAADCALRLAESGAENPGTAHLLRARLLQKNGRIAEAAQACHDAIARGVYLPSDLNAAAEMLFGALRALQSPACRGSTATRCAPDCDIPDPGHAEQPALDLCMRIDYCDGLLLQTRGISPAYYVSAHLREGYVRLMRSDAQNAQSHFTSAVQECRVLLARDSEDTFALRSLVHAYRGRAASSLLPACKKRIRGPLHSPDSCAAEYSAAAKACAELIRVAGETPERAWNLADCLEKAGRQKEAMAWYARSSGHVGIV